ncbi:hypothetical protein M231_05598 [Tremella mesenterica]|uniref:General negative regulator of transcription subunit n=1 Tax=Tremella mesenterica TaxID=5217 RepID=A0A4V1M3K1_TREME|nr:hypothetical protein M231_05598 [Tremella mesenterica]
MTAEIDKTLKGVSQGVEAFESTFDKLNHATNSAQKDKLENDLKTQIKKLQRMRDQIKAWLGSSEIKDKSALLDNRKLIETQMERFKALEKEMKMKAFSKEGLIAQSKLDPAEKAKRDFIEWIGTTVDELSRQIEATEAEVETLQATKKKKSGADRLGELEQLNERRQWHIGRLEVVQRMLENGQLTVEQVEPIQEDVKYFVETNTEEDFEFDNGIYDELNLVDEEDYLQDFSHHDEMSNLDSASLLDPSDAPKTPAKEEKDKRSVSGSKPTSQTIPEEAPPSPILTKRSVSRKTTQESAKAEPVKLPPKPEVPPVPPIPTAATAPAPRASLPPIRYAAAAAAAVAPSSASASIPSVPAPANPSSVSNTSTGPTHEPVAKLPEPAAVQPTQILEQENGPVPTTESPAVSSIGVPPTESPSLTNGLPPPPPGLSTSLSPVPQQPNPSHVVSSSFNGPQPPITPAISTASGGNVFPQQAQQAGSSRTPSSSYASGASPSAPQGVLGNLMQSFDMAKELSQHRANDLNELHSALDASFANAPHPSDGEPPRYYHPQNPIRTPSYYPQAQLPIFDDKTHVSRLDQDVLFFLFYYHPGTYEQWLAAQELKSQSWRFHKQYLTWFQRAYNPQAITEDYEQGGYVYFDWENSWCQRKKSDFRFEYRWLSDH